MVVCEYWVNGLKGLGVDVCGPWVNGSVSGCL